MRKIQKVGELPPGEYYLGDPCYVIRDDGDWKRFLSHLGDGEKDTDGVIIDWNGHKCFVCATNCGDGVYDDQHGNEYPVDAGMIAAIPIAAVKRNQGSRNFPKPFIVGADVGRWLKGFKRIKIGDVTIRT